MAGRPIRVLHVAEGAAFAGIETHVLTLAEAFRDTDVHMEASLFFDGQLARSLRESGMPCRILTRRSKFDRTAALEIAQAGNDADVIHSHGYLANIYASNAAKRALRPHVITVHGHREPFAGWKNLKMGLYMALDRRAARAADRVIAVSEPLARELEQSGVVRSRLRVAPNGLSDRARDEDTRRRMRETWGVGAEHVVVGFVGRFDPVKAPLRFLEIAKLVCAVNPSARFVVAGDGPLRETCEAWSLAGGIAKQVRFLGFRSDIDDVMAGFDLLLMPSDSEGVPQALLAAMRDGIGAICSRVGGIPDILDGLDDCLAPPNAPALAARLIPLVENDSRRAKLGAELRHRFETRFTAAIMAAHIEHIYREVVR